MINFKLVQEQTKNLNVLYIEDDVLVNETTAELLDNFFLTLDIAYNGKEGLNTYLAYKKEYDKYYDLVITDINMPEMDGIEMSIAILKNNPDQAIVVVTAMNETSMLYSILDSGINGFITKPIEHEKLMKLLFRLGHFLNNIKLLESQIDLIEDLNMKLEIQNKELIQKNKALEQSSHGLDTIAPKKLIDTDENNKNDDEADSHFEEQINDLIEDDLFELREIHVEIDLLIINVIAEEQLSNIDILEDLTSKFTKYASILSFYTFFDKLGSGMKDFASTIKTHPLPSSEENAKNTFILLESFICVLGKWQIDILNKDMSNINALDASMISDMETIVNTWTQKDDESSEEEWDDIFDF